MAHESEGLPGRDSVRASGVVTLAYVGEDSKSIGPASLQSFKRPSDALRGVLDAVVAQEGQVCGLIFTAETEDEETVATKLHSMQQYAQSGQILVSLATLELARNQLDPDFRFDVLGTFPLGTEGALERLFLVSHPKLSFARRAEPTKEREVERNPAGGPFIGRSRELADIQRRLDLAGVVSVVGPSGMGKSALIQRFVAEFGDEYPDGVIQVDFAGVTQPAVVGPTLMRLVEAVRLPGESPVEAFAAHLSDRRSLLVIDHADAVVSEVAHVVRAVRRRANNVAVLIGAIKAPRALGEARLRLEGLETPVGVEDPGVIAEYDAVALFVDRAQLVDPCFEVTKENAGAVARLCQRLDGIPLALELAASRVRILSPLQILHRLDDRFLLLQDKGSGRPDRHQTLRATIDWGHDQLRPEARILLRRLSVFEGAFSLDDATAVTPDDRHLTIDDVYNSFEELVDSSMLVASTVGGVYRRFYLGETVRLYAKEKLKAAGEATRLAERYRAWVLNLARNAEQGINGPDQLVWLSNLDAGYEDLRCFIEKASQSPGELDLALDVFFCIQQYFLHRSYHAEGFRMVRKLLKAAGVKKCESYPRLLNSASFLSARLGDVQGSRRYAFWSYRAALKTGNIMVEGIALSSLAGVADTLGRPRRSLRYYRRALACFEKTGDHRRQLIGCVNMLGHEHRLAGGDSARNIADRAFQLLDKLPDPVLRAVLESNLADIELLEGDFARCYELAVRASEYLAETGNISGVLTCFRNMTYALSGLGKWEWAAIVAGAHERLKTQADGLPAANQLERFDEHILEIRSHLGDLFEDYALHTIGLSSIEMIRSEFSNFSLRA